MRIIHPLLDGFEDATRIINATNQVEVKPLNDKLLSPLEIVPSYPDLPMEAVFPPPVTTHNPACSCRTSGAVVWSTSPETSIAHFWEVLDVDHAKLLRNAVLWAAE